MKLPLSNRKFLLLLISVVIVVALEILSITGIDIPMPYAPFVFAAFILGIGYKVIWDGLKALVKLNFSSIKLLMTIAVMAAFYLGEYPEAAVVIVLYTLSEELEDIGIKSSKSALDELVAKAPKTALLKITGEATPIEKVKIGSEIRIKPGDMIPLDGRIISGDTTIDEAPVTGEPIPKDKHKGDMVFAGTLNKNGYIEVETTAIAKDTTFSRIARLTFEAQMHKAKTQKFIQRFSKIYTPAVIVLAIAILVIPVYVMNRDFEYWLLQAVTLLVISCPCALVISTPVAIFAAIGNASSKGAMVKGGKYIEAMANLKAIALDKTRTITFGRPVVSDIIPLYGTTKAELLADAAGTEVFSEHPLAEAIIEAAKKEGIEPHKVQKFKSVIGKGVTAECLVCEDEEILVGKLNFIREHRTVTEEVEKIVERLTDQGKTSVVVSLRKGIAGVIGLTDEIKPDSAAALAQIGLMNIETVMLTGDSEKTAHYVAEQTGINKVYGGLLPENKSEKIKELLKQYKVVAMVGDGINDAPALAQSTVGIAMGAAGSASAIETANIALMNDKLSLIPFLIRLSKATVARIRFSIIGAILVKLIFIGLAISGHSNLALAIAADVGVTLVVILVGLNLVKYK